MRIMNIWFRTKLKFNVIARYIQWNKSACVLSVYKRTSDNNQCD